MLIGEDLRNIEHLYQKLYRHSFFRMGVIGMSAISGVEQACWDIFGKSLRSPVIDYSAAKYVTESVCIPTLAAGI